MNCLNVSNSFGLICRAINSQCDLQIPQTNESQEEFIVLLNYLNAKERLLAAKYFCQLPANVGSFRVLGQLQQLGILTATEYVLSKQQSEQLQVDLIIFLESQHELLSNVFLSAAFDSEYGMILTSILIDALRNLFMGLARDPKISNLSYVEALCQSLPSDALGVCVHMHLGVLLELHESTEIGEAFANFSAWINEGVDELTFIRTIALKLLAKHQLEALNYLFKQSIEENFKNWKFYLILVQAIASCGQTETQAFMKKYLKNRLIHTASIGCFSSFLHFLLTARAISANTMDVQQNLENYALWYKQNIGEMSYALDMDKFQVVLNMLNDSLHLEQEVAYLEIHVAIAIAPGGKLVQAYKTKCRTHLSQLKADAKRKGAVIELD
ncbi:uncharacterized protein [Drosophila tropicalis]|uniref:uncharacterized protein n=1 Tax=Drosophila tropicalis TaxID=46794 RepID=UPI0035ABABAB